MLDRIVKLAQFLGEYLKDFFLAIRFNTYSPFEQSNRKLFYRIIILSHAIEKGLSLPNPRRLFGREKIELLMKMIRAFDRKHSIFPLEMARGALLQYVDVHHALGLTDPFLRVVGEFANDQVLFANVEPKGGVKKAISVYRNQEVSLETNLVFIKSRFSCRSYKEQVVREDIVKNLVSMAQWAPSQCNRQSVRVHCYQEKTKIEELLLLQGGSAGFYEGVYNLFVVTSEITAWGGFGQRNQGYVDGGLFSMGLLLACHASGIGACALNLAVSNAHEKRIKEVGGIHPRERLIMMIAFGYPTENELSAAMSPRLPVEFVLQKH